jgi:hypothetical protein
MYSTRHEEEKERSVLLVREHHPRLWRGQHGHRQKAGFINAKLAFRPLGFDCGQGVIRFKSGAYTPVREHFESNRNAVHGQKMMA